MNAALDAVADTLDLLNAWARRGWLRPLDAAFAAFLARETEDAPPLAIFAAALASHQLGRGHACLDLAQTLDDPGFALSLPPDGERDTADAEAPMPPIDALAGVGLDAWRAALRHPALTGDGPGATPLVCAGNRVYLRRYWQYERDVGAGIAARLAAPPEISAAALREALDALFPPASDAAGPDWQKLACALAARNAFAIVAGGPGTGKTTTVVRLLAVLQALAFAATPAHALRIRLAAPTGKAAARLNESVAGAVARLDLSALPNGEAVRAAIPVQVATLHRLLGSRPDTRRFRHRAGNPLPVDVLVVDEASMIDLETMAATLDALPPTARLILLGDKDQLASVEAGAVFGELCRHAQQARYTPGTAAWLGEIAGAPLAPAFVDSAGQPLDQAVAMLRHSYRFGENGGIGQLATAVNAGDAEAARRILACGHADLANVKLGEEGEAALRALVIDGQCGPPRPTAEDASPQGYRGYLRTLRALRPPAGAPREALDEWARRTLAAHGQFQVLCAPRRGQWGVEGLNERIAGWLRDEGLIAATEGWYAGRPVLVTRNDYSLGLMNGDIGIALELPAAVGPGPLRVAFPSGDGGVKWVQPSRLQAVETVYALTVHKSQGSEFGHAALILPERANPILTRELVYTGITRAKRRFSLIEAGHAGVLAQSVQRRVLRLGGLLAALQDDG